MYTTVLLSSDSQRAIMLRSHHQRNTKREKKPVYVARTESVYGTKSYRDAVQRAFNVAKTQVYFNPDMTNFITLTYAGADHTPQQVMHDIKMLVKRESRMDRAQRGEIKYIWIMEYQKRGSIHVHMIANDCFSLQVNRNGYNELKYWKKGFSSVLHIRDFDGNFRPHLYLFKYMRKAQRIGKSFVHSSRNLKNHTQLTDTVLNLSEWRTTTQELTTTTVNTTKLTYYKNYLEKDDTMATSTKQGTPEWLKKVKLHSSKVQAKLVENRTPHYN